MIYIDLGRKRARHTKIPDFLRAISDTSRGGFPNARSRPLRERAKRRLRHQHPLSLFLSFVRYIDINVVPTAMGRSLNENDRRSCHEPPYYSIQRCDPTCLVTPSNCPPKKFLNVPSNNRRLSKFSINLQKNISSEIIIRIL